MQNKDSNNGDNLKSSIIGSAYLISASILILASATGNVNGFVGTVALTLLILGIGITLYHLVNSIKF
ncbi:hypothetical protein EII17_08855 [Clostridiales bacterium COT073_COT-073]|nr:hypothetical protein EII17_08855 [Clostridiales bacterium COT073_COT-073]